MTCTVEDVTELEALRARAVECVAASVDAGRLSLAGSLAAPMAHDLANLLTVILPTLDILRRSDGFAPRDAELIDAANHAGTSVVHVARQLVSLVRGAAPAGVVEVATEIDAAVRRAPSNCSQRRPAKAWPLSVHRA